MECKDRKGMPVPSDAQQDAILRKLYGTAGGRMALKVLVRPWVSRLGGAVLSSRISKLAIPGFVKKNGIDMRQYEHKRYKSYNDFFTRRIRKGMRPVEPEPAGFISPCDSRLTVHEICDGASFHIKNTQYTMHSLFRDSRLAEEYRGGLLLLFRLTVDDYHRYCYTDNGTKSCDTYINGVFHTVNPFAGQILPIYKENSRCYCTLETENFGKLLHMEVGALMVGKIVNYHKHGGFSFKRGQEKGRFEFGGSTVILCVKKDVLRVDEDILANSREGIETKVRMGEKIGERI